ncbi:hypothetical protein COEREDRAFT_82568 [Coemansia reversa NRRL 1564]|uniref:Uncharacterized protein n=1 Tax=Coemansia reversa (strain ATCC 12441 / NRRL 1564) TaxID=763665 RepID=A0A2G5B6K8_COERN|nr:hypothetical protein COEREDRAFT_82568 [Coemansia reversa NRRL 1564]|eukprot:PIA14683.1 hypothetical protein COEREDRAFT_82568 [Coemansia reversa NRRL 1564]
MAKETRETPTQLVDGPIQYRLDVANAKSDNTIRTWANRTNQSIAARLCVWIKYSAKLPFAMIRRSCDQAFEILASNSAMVFLPNAPMIWPFENDSSMALADIQALCIPSSSRMTLKERGNIGAGSKELTRVSTILCGAVLLVIKLRNTVGL